MVTGQGPFAVSITLPGDDVPAVGRLKGDRGKRTDPAVSEFPCWYSRKKS